MLRREYIDFDVDRVFLNFTKIDFLTSSYGLLIQFYNKHLFFMSTFNFSVNGLDLDSSFLDLYTTVNCRSTTGL